MLAELKNIICSDLDLENDCPADQNNFGLYVDILVGPTGVNGHEVFTLLICSPDWLKQKCKEEYFFAWQHLIIIHEYNFIKIKNIICSKLEKIQASNWEDISLKLSKLMFSEFEDWH